MPRATFSTPRKLLLACVFIAASGVWWWQRPPPDPVHDGKPLSAYLVHFPQRNGDVIVSADQIKAYGPAGVAWLTYMVEHGKPRFVRKGPLPLDKAPDWLRRMAPDRWGGLRRSVADDERVSAMEMLRRFGSDAAPAIPALLRNLEINDAYFAYSAAEALHAIGPASWPIVLHILENGSPGARAALLETLCVRLEDEGRATSEAMAAPAVTALVKGLGDPAPRIRSAAAEGIGGCLMRRKDSTRYESAIPVLFRIVSDPDQHPSQAICALSSFGDKAAFAIPRFIELLDDSNTIVRSVAASCLPAVDKTGEHCAPALRKMYHNADAACRAAAASALGELGLSPDEETTSAKKSPTQ